MDLKTYIADTGITQQKFAEKIGADQALVSRWVNGLPVPSKRWVAIEEATNGKVTRQDLRPDLYAKPKNGGARK